MMNRKFCGFYFKFSLYLGNTGKMVKNSGWSCKNKTETFGINFKLLT
jgi:hypothetical protein